MSRTKRQIPRNGQFKKLKASKKNRNKKQRATNANLQIFIRPSKKYIGFSNRNPATGLKNIGEDVEQNNEKTSR